MMSSKSFASLETEIKKDALNSGRLFYLVRGKGLEPPRDDSHMPLKHACLPIPAPPLVQLLGNEYLAKTSVEIVG